MTLSEIRAQLQRLEGASADAIESETLECKPWDPHPQAFDSQIRVLREAVVAFANQQGGVVLLGISDRKRTRKDAIHGVGRLDIGMLRRRIYDGTEPHILVDIRELMEPEGRVLVIEVPKGIPPHTTSEGIAKIRIGKDSMPLTGSDIARLLFTGGQKDLTAQILPDSSLADLDPEELKRLRRIVGTEGTNPELARLPDDAEFLGNLELIRDGRLTLVAVLLLGKATAMARWAPQHEVIFARFKTATRYDIRRDFKGPLLAVLEAIEKALQESMRVTLARAAGFAELSVPELDTNAVREALLNALVHRDYFLRQSVHVHLYEDRLEVSSPGGFIGGVSPDNILRHPPVRRNPHLADMLNKAGLVNRLGMGVDRIYEELLKLGKRKPFYEANESHVRLVLPTTTHMGFAKFVADEVREGRKLELDDLICLRALSISGHMDRWTAARELQLGDDQSAERLASLRARGYMVPHGRGRSTVYRLNRRLSDLLRGQEATDHELPLDEEAVRLRVQAVLEERGKLTNAEIRRISGYSRIETVRLMHKLMAAGHAKLVSRGRGAHYVPGKKPPRK
ncbi:MAG: putative DNA binding domain-containing protein [Elusimicrobia bacterium]|nr:putative DNA binding domain-containing protein [Elusimicrobiota bacterium]